MLVNIREKSNSSCLAPILITRNISKSLLVPTICFKLSLTLRSGLRSVEVHLTFGFEGTVVSDGGLGSGDPGCLLFG
jgi:hypothetical protein